MKNKLNRRVALALVIGVLLSFEASFSQEQVKEEPVMKDKQPSADGRITLELKGMDVVEVLKILAGKAGLDLVIGSTVSGRVTMFLKDVDVMDAFEIILMANNLALDKRGDISYIMTQRDYELLYGERYGDKKEIQIVHLKNAKAVEAGKVLSQIKTNIGKVIIDENSNTVVIIDSPSVVSHAERLLEIMDAPTRTEVFELKYAVAKDLKDKMEPLVTKGVGNIQMDERTNKIAVTDTEDALVRIEGVVKAFDTRLQQVLIEAKIIEVTLTDVFKFGVDWQLVTSELQKQIKEQLSIKSAFKLAAPGAFIPGGEILIGNFSDSDYSAMVQVLKTIGDANVLSSPRITVMNNQEAKILVGSNEPYATSTVTQGTSTSTTSTNLTFLDIGVKLYVTPTINNDGNVTIKVKPEVSTKSGTYSYYVSGSEQPTTVPIVSTTQAETCVMIKDGNTVIIAGLIKDDRSGAENKVPFLGDIPLAGTAFKKTDNTITKKELVIFLTPHIISGETDVVEHPMTAPIGEKRFTMPESPTFERREPQVMKPGFMSEKRAYGGQKERITPVSGKMSPDEYFELVKSMIAGKISETDMSKDRLRQGSVKVSFMLSSGGYLLSGPTIEESSNAELDNVTLTAVKSAAPFPAFPISMGEKEKSFTVDIMYQ